MSGPADGRLAYVPGPMRITRRLSADGEVLVRAGDQVDAETALIAMHTFPGRVLRNQVAAGLRINPAETEDSVVAPAGHVLAVGDIVARSSMFWRHRVARTAYEGSVAGVSPSLGVVYMREHVPTQVAETVRINVIEELGGDKNRFSSYVKVKEGDKVEKGQVIATREESHKYTNIFSPVFGTIANVAPLLGALSIVPDQVSSVVTAHIPGRVAAIRGSREVDVEGFGVIFEGLVGIGGETHGNLVAAGNSPAPWRPDGAVPLAGSVAVTGHVDETSLRQAAAVGVKAVIAGRAHEAALCRFGGKELGVIATGEEDLPLVLVLTEGFGEGAMHERTYATLASLAGCQASLSGATHIRAGVIRPRILVSTSPAPAERRMAAADTPNADRTIDHSAARTPSAVGLVETPTELATGLRARILRGRHAGRSGTILDLPFASETIATGASVLVAVVRLDPATPIPDGGTAELVRVPQANLKLEGGAAENA